MGAEITTERAMFRAGERVSPAAMAMYSNPVKAPSASLLPTLTLYSENVGNWTANGSYGPPSARRKSEQRQQD